MRNWRSRVVKLLIDANIAIPDLPIEEDKIEVITAISNVLKIINKQEMDILERSMKNVT